MTLYSTLVPLMFLLFPTTSPAANWLAAISSAVAAASGRIHGERGCPIHRLLSTVLARLRRRPPSQKTVSIRHFDLRKRLRIEHCVLGNDSVDRKQVSGHRVDFVIGQRLRS